MVSLILFGRSVVKCYQCGKKEKVLARRSRGRNLDNENGRRRSHVSLSGSETAQTEESRHRESKEMNVEKRWESMIEEFIKNGNHPFWFGL